MTSVRPKFLSPVLTNILMDEFTKDGLQKLIDRFKMTDEIAFDIMGLLRNGVSHKEISKLKSWDDVDQLSYYEDYRLARYTEDRSLTMDDTAVEEGEYKCKNPTCQSKRCIITDRQDRAGDEGATIHVTCSICGTHYSFNS